VGLEALGARWLAGGSQNLTPPATRALIIEGFVVETSTILFKPQIEVRPSFVQASQSFSISEGLTIGGLGGEGLDPSGPFGSLGWGLEGDRETSAIGLFLVGEPWTASGPGGKALM
jgi:hypothetical protein